MGTSIVFNYFDLDSEKYVIENTKLLTRKSPVKIGDASKLRSLTGWRPSMNYHEFVIQLIKDHLAAGISM